jgi:hypothetical protein
MGIEWTILYYLRELHNDSLEWGWMYSYLYVAVEYTAKH